MHINPRHRKESSISDTLTQHHNEMLNHYNCIGVGSLKEIFQGVDTNNLQEVLQAL